MQGESEKVRKIKFRAKTKHSKTWLELDSYYLTFEDITNNWFIVDEEDMIIASQEDNDILEQYTGLKDKNGVEIYEGDRYQFQFMQELYKGIIIYKEELARFVVELEDLCGKYYEVLNQTNDVNYFCEVIGNIHE